MDAMSIHRDEWLELAEAGDEFCLDLPAHLLAYVRAKAYEGAVAAERWLDEAHALRDGMGSRDGACTAEQYAQALSQCVRMGQVHTGYLRLLLATVELYAPDPRLLRGNAQ